MKIEIVGNVLDIVMMGRFKENMGVLGEISTIREKERKPLAVSG